MFYSDPNFSSLQHNFMEKHYLKFEECEENKLEYMEIFNTYVSIYTHLYSILLN